MLTVGLHIRRRAGAPELDRLLFALVDQETVGTLAPLYGVTAGLRAAILPERCDRQGASPRMLWILRSTSAGTPERGRTRCAAGDRPLGTPSNRSYHVRMRHDKIDEAVLPLLYLGIHERYPTVGARAWKSFDWEALNRLHGKGLISDPVSKARSVVLTENGPGAGGSGLPPAVRGLSRTALPADQRRSRFSLRTRSAGTGGARGP